jgi:hypothetical protein
MRAMCSPAAMKQTEEHNALTTLASGSRFLFEKRNKHKNNRTKNWKSYFVRIGFAIFATRGF